VPDVEGNLGWPQIVLVLEVHSFGQAFAHFKRWDGPRLELKYLASSGVTSSFGFMNAGGKYSEVPKLNTMTMRDCINDRVEYCVNRSFHVLCGHPGMFVSELFKKFRSLHLSAPKQANILPS
jgi:hypothetical protein